MINHVSRAVAASVVLALVAALTLGACTTGTADSSAASAPTARSGAESIDDWSADCAVLEHPPLQLGGHLVGDNPPPQDYSSTPPTSGWHSRTVPEAGVAHDGLSDPQIASALEAGIVVVATAPDVDTAQLATLLDQFPDRLLATTYTEPMPSPVALLTWGTVARCDTLAATDVTTFVLTERVDPDGH